MKATDGDRWRAFLSSARIRLIGWAGFGPIGDNPLHDIPGDVSGYRHMGFEIWTRHSHENDPDCVAERIRACRLLEAYTDEVLRKNPSLLTPPPSEWDLIQKLRADEGNTVTIAADNGSFEGPNSIVVCCGDWTSFNDRGFEGDSVLDALTKAYREYERVNDHSQDRTQTDQADSVSVPPQEDLYSPVL